MKRFLRLNLFYMLAISVALVVLLAFAPLAFPQGSVKGASDYDIAYLRAVRENKTLVVFVNTRPQSLPDYCVGIRCEDYNGSDRPRILDFIPDGKGGLKTGNSYPASTVFESGVSREASPFASSGLRPGEVPIADGDADDGGLPSFISDLEPYTSATQTQVTFRRWSGYIAPSPRSRLELKWRVPGGLAGIHGWSSKLYRSRVRARVFLVRQDPSDGNSAVTWGRSYPDGAIFADVLRNERGRVFEVRVAEKQGGEWERFIAFKDVSQRPHGYFPPSRAECAACHRKAGASEYGGAANPGADTVLSDPFDNLESGQTVQGGYGTAL